MSQMKSLLEREISRWDGVTYEVEHGGAHPKLRLRYGEESRFLTFSKTKVAPRGALNKVTELRRTLHGLGAHRKA